MCPKRIFNIRDKVFATTPGYPPWPSIIIDVLTNSLSKLRYNVYFYGTGGTFLCKSKHLYPYKKFKKKFSNPEGKLSVLKYFAAALIEIKNDTDTIDDELIHNTNNTIKQESYSDDLKNELDNTSADEKQINQFNLKNIDEPNLLDLKNTVLRKTEYTNISKEISNIIPDKNTQVITTSSNINNTKQQTTSDKLKNFSQVDGINQYDLENKEISFKDEPNLPKVKNIILRKKRHTKISKEISSAKSDKNTQVITTLSDINNTNHQTTADKLENFSQVEGINQSDLENKEISIKGDPNLPIVQNIVLKKTGRTKKLKIISHVIPDKYKQVITTSSNINNTNQQTTSDKLKNFSQVDGINQSDLENKEISFKDEPNLPKVKNIILKKTGHTKKLKIISNAIPDKNKQVIRTSSNINSTNQQTTADKLKNFSQVEGINQSDLENKEISFKDEPNLPKVKNIILKKTGHTKKLKIISNAIPDKNKQVITTSSNINSTNQQTTSDKLKNFSQVEGINQSDLENKNKPNLSVVRNMVLRNTSRTKISSAKSDKNTQVITTLSDINNTNHQTTADKLENFSQVEGINQSDLENKEISIKGDPNLPIVQNIVLKKTGRTKKLKILSNVIPDKNKQVITTSSNINSTNQQTTSDKLKNFSQVEGINQSDLENKNKPNLSVVRNMVLRNTRRTKISSAKSDKNTQVITTLSDINNTNHQTTADKLENFSQVEGINQSDLENKEISIKGDPNLPIVQSIVLKKTGRPKKLKIISNAIPDKNKQVITTSSNINSTNQQTTSDKLKNFSQVEGINQSVLENKNKPNLSVVRNMVLRNTRRTKMSNVIPEENTQVITTSSNINNTNQQTTADKLNNFRQVKGLNQSHLNNNEHISIKDEPNLSKVQKLVLRKTGRNRMSKTISNVISDKNTQVITTSNNINNTNQQSTSDKLENSDWVEGINQSYLENKEKISIRDEPNLTTLKNIGFMNIKNSKKIKMNHLFSDNLVNTNKIEEVNKSKLKIEKKRKNKKCTKKKECNVYQSSYKCIKGDVLNNIIDNDNNSLFITPSKNKSVSFSDKPMFFNEIDNIKNCKLESEENITINEFKKKSISTVPKGIKRKFADYIPEETSLKSNKAVLLDDKLKLNLSVQLDKLSDDFIARALGKQQEFAAYYVVNCEGQIFKTNNPSVEYSNITINDCKAPKPISKINNNSTQIYKTSFSNSENVNHVSCSNAENQSNTTKSIKYTVSKYEIDQSLKHSTKTKDTEGLEYKVKNKTKIDDKELSIAQYELETNILSCLHNLRVSLQINNVNYKTALATLDSLSELKFTTYILLKYKMIIDTISKVSRYNIGDINESILNKQELNNAKQAQMIRCKAQTLLNIFISLFTEPLGETFEKVYNKNSKAFSIK